MFTSNPIRLEGKRADPAPNIAGTPRAIDGRSRQPLGSLRSLFEPLVSCYCPVRQEEAAAHSLPDHGFDCIKHHPARDLRLVEFARLIKVIPGYLYRVLDQKL
jgi:hypothetical protein